MLSFWRLLKVDRFKRAAFRDKFDSDWSQETDIDDGIERVVKAYEEGASYDAVKTYVDCVELLLKARDYYYENTRPPLVTYLKTNEYELD